MHENGTKTAHKPRTAREDVEIQAGPIVKFTC